MTRLTYTLVTDGSSDQVLRYPIDWLLRQWSDLAPDGRWADPGIFAQAPRGLAEKIRGALEYYPCELLFVHRDAEARPREDRVAEIQEALADTARPPAVCVVPVRMTEAWFLFDLDRLRVAAGNPRGTEPLSTVEAFRLEDLPDPKVERHGLLRSASGLRGRRAKAFNPRKAAHRLADLIEDFCPLRQLAAFRAFEEELCLVLQENRWLRPA